MYKILTLAFFMLSNTSLMASDTSLSSTDSEMTSTTQSSSISTGRKGLSKTTYLEYIGLGKEETELRQYVLEKRKSGDNFDRFVDKIIKEYETNSYNEILQALDTLKMKQIESEIKLKEQARHILKQIQTVKTVVPEILRKKESQMITYLKNRGSEENPFLKIMSPPRSPGSITRTLSHPEMYTDFPTYIDENMKQNMLKNYITYLGFPNFQNDLKTYEETKNLKKAGMLMTILIRDITENLAFSSPYDDYIRIMAFLRLSERIDDLNKSMIKIQFIKK